MTKYNRPNGKLFGSSATNIGVFGSGQSGETYATTTDPNAANTLGTHWEQGWDGAVVSQAPYTAPFIEDMNAVNYVNSYNSAYLLQKGIPEYDANEEYQTDSVCTYNGEIWICLQDGVTGTTPSEGAYWHLQAELPVMNDNEILVGTTGVGATVTDTLNQGDVEASISGLNVKAGSITNNHISSQAGDEIAESKIALAYDTSSLHTDIGNVSGSLNSHTTDTNNPHTTSVSNLSDTTISSLSDEDILSYDNNGAVWVNKAHTLGNVKDVSISSATDNDVLLYYNGNWINSPTVNNHITNKTNPHETKVSNLFDATITSPQDGEVLTYDANSSKWINAAGGGGGGGLSDIGYKSISGFPIVEAKQYANIGINTYGWISANGSVAYDFANQTEYTIANAGISGSSLVANTKYYIFYSPSNNSVLAIKFSDCVSSPSEPVFSTDAVWYNTSTNVFKAGKGATSWSDTVYNDLCVPLAIVENGACVKVFDTVASAFMDTVFLYPNTSMLFPYGKDTDGTYLNEKGYIVGSANVMKKVSVIKSTYKGLNVTLVGNTSSWSPKKSGNVIITDRYTYIGAYPISASGYTQIFSTYNNNWFTSSNGTTISGTSFTSKYGCIFLYEDSDGYITDINTQPVLDLATKDYARQLVSSSGGALDSLTDVTLTSPTDKQLLQYDYASSQWVNSSDVWDRITANDIAQIRDTSGDFTVTSNMPHEQIINFGTACTITLSDPNIKAGEKFVFACSTTDANTSTPFTFKSANGNTIISWYCPYYIQRDFVAKVDNPQSASDWLTLYYFPARSFRTQGIQNFSNVGNTVQTSGLLKTLPIYGYYNVQLDWGRSRSSSSTGHFGIIVRDSSNTVYSTLGGGVYDYNESYGADASALGGDFGRMCGSTSACIYVDTTHNGFKLSTISASGTLATVNIRYTITMIDVKRS